MEKAHSRIKWENYPSIATPLNETNLNKMDIALDEVDNRVLGLDTAKLDKAVANTMVKDIAFNEKTGIFTITLLDGTTKTIDTKLEKVATNFSYDYETQKLVLTLVDGTEQEIDMSTLISQYEFADTSTIGFTVGNEGKITAIVKDGSITEAKLQPNFLANVKTEVSKAKSYADSSYENATTSRNAVTEAKQYRDEALQFRNEAENFAPEGYADLVEQVNENTVKVDTIIAKADLGIKETASGQEIHLTDSAEGKAVEFALYGKAKQNTTTGKNFLENTASSQELNGVVFTVNEDKSITVKGKATALTTVKINTLNNDEISKLNGHILSGGTNYCFISVQTKSTYTTYATSKGSEAVINVSTEENVDIYCSIQNGVVVDETIYPMISVNGGEYEKYTGGATPRPDYEQPIEVSGESGSVAVKSCGKNLLRNIVKSTTPNGGNVTVNADKSITINGTFTETTYLNLDYAVNVNNSLTDLSNLIGKKLIASISNVEISGIGLTIGYFKKNGETASYPITFTKQEIVFPTEAYKGRNYVRIGAGTYNNVTVYPMLRLATDTDDTYESYKETLVTIPTENGLAGIKVSSGGNYTDSNGQQWICDEIVKYADGSGAYIQRISSLILEGQTNWQHESSWNNVYAFYATNLLSKAKVVPGYGKVANALCNRLKVDTATNLSSGKVMTGFAQGSGYNLYVSIEGIDNRSDLNAYFAENKAVIYYELENPITTPLTAEEIAEIEKLQTFYPITNISNDFDCGMSIKYNADSKNYIDNKIALLTTAMINNI